MGLGRHSEPLCSDGLFSLSMRRTPRGDDETKRRAITSLLSMGDRGMGMREQAALPHSPSTSRRASPSKSPSSSPAYSYSRSPTRSPTRSPARSPTRSPSHSPARSPSSPSSSSSSSFSPRSRRRTSPRPAHLSPLAHYGLRRQNEANDEAYEYTRQRGDPRPRPDHAHAHTHTHTGLRSADALPPTLPRRSGGGYMGLSRVQRGVPLSLLTLPNIVFSLLATLGLAVALLGLHIFLATVSGWGGWQHGQHHDSVLEMLAGAWFAFRGVDPPRPPH